MSKFKSLRTAAFIISLALPTLYTIIVNYGGLYARILDLARVIKVDWIYWLPLSMEYLVFTVLFVLTIALMHGIDGLLNFYVPISFLGIIGIIYTIDTLYPWGRFTPFQLLVPATTQLSAGLLNFIGYETSVTFITSSYYGWLPRLAAWNPKNPSMVASFGIGWPCAGIESLIVYTIIILLFLRQSSIPLKQKIAYFAIGAVITYFINILRIVTIFLIAINKGDFMSFHDFYGQLYSITWITSYPLIIIGSRTLWGKIKKQSFRIGSLLITHS
ncbi:archaeosortase/exosortase family protein [Candidatus Bathyarchaeota archaeon]|nr:archaeosortase/exosortase family protein [Candidatus Bathyarchaeota archaeon]